MKKVIVIVLSLVLVGLFGASWSYGAKPIKVGL